MSTLVSRSRGALDPASFSAVQTLRDGKQVEIRALRPADRDGLKAAIERLGSASLYRRFFSPKRHFSEKEVDHFVNVDFVRHVALVAVADGVIIGGGRYIIVRPGVAELAFAIVDEYQGKGLGAALLRHLISLARDAALSELVAHVLPDNRSMLAVFEKCGVPIKTRREDGAVAVILNLSEESVVP
jgi:RimJ/RimL family protein N-acetyltransferase